MRPYKGPERAASAYRCLGCGVSLTDTERCRDTQSVHPAALNSQTTNDVKCCLWLPVARTALHDTGLYQCGTRGLQGLFYCVSRKLTEALLY